jgi:hypothetical protein
MEQSKQEKIPTPFEQQKIDKAGASSANNRLEITYCSQAT